MLYIKNIITKKGAECPVLVFFNGKREIFVSFDLRVMCSVSGLSPREIYTLPVDEHFNINY